MHFEVCTMNHDNIAYFVLFFDLKKESNKVFLLIMIEELQLPEEVGHHKNPTCIGKTTFE
jgi:hypothetical protein